tara:strand:- start:1009 stop:1173 length:165 start_codon:yes stop_codon:yes gene_type:complete
MFNKIKKLFRFFIKYVNLNNDEKFLMAKKSYNRCKEKFSFESRRRDLEKILASL